MLKSLLPFHLCGNKMEPLTIIRLVGNIVQFVDFSGKLISKSTELYRSGEGALAENIDTETATTHLVWLKQQASKNYCHYRR